MLAASLVLLLMLAFSAAVWLAAKLRFRPIIAVIALVPLVWIAFGALAIFS